MKSSYPVVRRCGSVVFIRGLVLGVLLAPGCLMAAEAERDGEQVYAAACAACHDAGILQAPRLGQKQDWIEREKQGFEVLLKHALKGFKNMPAKGGNPTIKDPEIKNAVIYMLVAAGFESYAPETQKQPSQAKAASTDAAPSKPATKVTISQANQFNRLMQPPAQWNRAPADDGFHDPASPGTLLLQEPRVAFEALSKSRSGNRVDWVRALQGNEIRPRHEVSSDAAQPVVMDLNIVREVKGSMPDVVYPHKEHTEWLDCSNCHPAIFIPQKGANQISMASILLGQKCGVCHGKVAFPVSECRRCHSKMKPAATTQPETGN